MPRCRNLSKVTINRAQNKKNYGLLYHGLRKNMYLCQYEDDEGCFGD